MANEPKEDETRIYRNPNGGGGVVGLYEHRNERGDSVEVFIEAKVRGDGAGEEFLHRFAEDTHSFYLKLAEALKEFNENNKP